MHVIPLIANLPASHATHLPSATMVLFVHCAHVMPSVVATEPASHGAMQSVKLTRVALTQANVWSLQMKGVGIERQAIVTFDK